MGVGVLLNDGPVSGVVPVRCVKGAELRPAAAPEKQPGAGILGAPGVACTVGPIVMACGILSTC